MGSIGNPNPLVPYANNKDCSRGICSIYCPQFCYLIFSPPPPSDDDSSPPFSPLIIAIIGVLASALLLVSYYTIVKRYCRRRNNNTRVETEETGDRTDNNQWPTAPTGLDETLIKTIKVCKYTKGDGMIEGSECAVCLSEFQENESLRLLPKCSHAFHISCIDTWLKSHSNCPLCRASVVVSSGPSTSLEAISQTSTIVSTNFLESRRQNDLIFVVDDQEMNCHIQENVNEIVGNDQECVEQFRRSISLGTFSCQRHVLISDILKIDGFDDGDFVVESDDHRGSIGSSRGGLGDQESKLGNKRGVELITNPGTFMLAVQDKGKNSIIPN